MVKHSTIHLSQAIEGYFIIAKSRRLAPGTLSDYDNTLRRLEQFLGSDPALGSITADDIREFLSSLDGLSAKTILNYHVGLSALWTWAIAEGLLELNVVRSVRPPRPEKREVAPYSERDIKAMLVACDRAKAYSRPGKRPCDNSRPTAYRDRATILLLVDTGLRASELCDLRCAHLDIKNYRLRVLGKGRKERILPISPATAKALWRYHATRENLTDTSSVFATRDGTPMERNCLRQTLQVIGQRAGVPDVTVHRFRHTFAIMFLRNGGTVFALQRLLGHSSLDMVERYVAIAQTDIERAHKEASPVTNWAL